MEVVRFNVEIPKDLHNQLNSRIPWGVKSRLFRQILVMLNQDLAHNGDSALARWLTWKPGESLPWSDY